MPTDHEPQDEPTAKLEDKATGVFLKNKWIVDNNPGCGRVERSFREKQK